MQRAQGDHQTVSAVLHPFRVHWFRSTGSSRRVQVRVVRLVDILDEILPCYALEWGSDRLCTARGRAVTRPIVVAQPHVVLLREIEAVECGRQRRVEFHFGKLGKYTLKSRTYGRLFTSSVPHTWDKIVTKDLGP